LCLPYSKSLEPWTGLTGIFWTSGSEREFTLEGSCYANEEIQAGADRDVVTAGWSGTRQRENHSQACKEAEITAQTYSCWRKEFGGLKLDQAKRLKELERENAKLKRLVADLSLEKQILKDVDEGNF
jgi:hypothetical protein